MAHGERIVPVGRRRTEENVDDDDDDERSTRGDEEREKESWFVVAPECALTGESLVDESWIAENYLFVHKPSGLLTLPGRTEPDCLAARVAARYPGDGDFLPRPCHRLDRDTSGVVLFGRTADAHRDASRRFERREVVKTYVALVADDDDDDDGTIALPIGKERDAARGHARWVVGGEKPREAVTEWRTSARFPDVGISRRILSPRTGRGHQLRLHCAATGRPILGDALHAPPDVAVAAPALCLHAAILEIDVVDGRRRSRRARATSTPPF